MPPRARGMDSCIRIHSKQIDTMIQNVSDAALNVSLSRTHNQPARHIYFRITRPLVRMIHETQSIASVSVADYTDVHLIGKSSRKFGRLSPTAYMSVPKGNGLYHAMVNVISSLMVSEQLIRPPGGPVQVVEPSYAKMEGRLASSH